MVCKECVVDGREVQGMDCAIDDKGFDGMDCAVDVKGFVDVIVCKPMFKMTYVSCTKAIFWSHPCVDHERSDRLGVALPGDHIRVNEVVPVHQQQEVQVLPSHYVMFLQNNALTCVSPCAGGDTGDAHVDGRLVEVHLLRRLCIIHPYCTVTLGKNTWIFNELY